MTPVDKETYSYWVTHPHDLSQTDIGLLQTSLLAHPYCQTMHTLLAKASTLHQRSQSPAFIRHASAHALSRNALRRLIDNEFQWSDNLLSRISELSGADVPIPDAYQQESYTFAKSKPSLFDSLQQLNLSLQALYESNRMEYPVEASETPTAVSEEVALATLADSTDDIQASETPIPQQTLSDETSLNAATLQAEPIETALVLEPEAAAEPLTAEPAPSAAQLREQQRQQQIALIDSFIQNEPRISPIRSLTATTDEQEDLTQRIQPLQKVLVTESFAKILVRQGKKEKAREIYEQLIVKNPSKMAYFAAKIDELNEP